MTRLKNLARRLARSKHGNVAVMTTLTMPLLVAAVGGAYDFGAMYQHKTNTQMAADQASLAAAKQQSDRQVQGGGSGAGTSLAAYAEKLLRLNDPQLASNAQIDSQLINDDSQVSVEVKSGIPTIFLKLIGIDRLDYEVRAVAQIAKRKYVDFYFLVDVSESMNIAATEADRLKLLKTTLKGTKGRETCFFACHEPITDFSPLSYYEMNQRAGSGKAVLRIDVLNDALRSAVDGILESNSDPNSLVKTRVALTFFSETSKIATPPTTDAAVAKKLIGNPGIYSKHTNVNQALSEFSSFLGSQGTGDSVDDPLKVAIFTTDGVRDESANAWSQIALGTIDTLSCRQIKQKTIDLAVLEIKYLEFYDYQNHFRNRVQAYYKDISPTLNNCASPGLHYVASESSDLKNGMEQLINKLHTADIRLVF
nr:pilus assembly protein TadG-related protein [Fulvimarina endophytica]